MTAWTRHSLAACAFVALSVSPALSVAAPSCALPATPFGARVEMVAPDMRNNGGATNIRILEAKLPVEAVLDFYRRLWAPLATSERPGSMEQNVNEWRVISTLDGKCFTSVQAKAKGEGTYALVAVTQKPDATIRRPSSVADFPTLPGSKVVSDMDFIDGVRNARTVVVSSPATVASNVSFYTMRLKDQGWVPIMRGTPDSQRGAHEVLVLKRGFEEMNLVISPAADGKVTIVANVVDRP
jgi:hypothetical protein